MAVGFNRPVLVASNILETGSRPMTFAPAWTYACRDVVQARTVRSHAAVTELDRAREGPVRHRIELSGSLVASAPSRMSTASCI